MEIIIAAICMVAFFTSLWAYRKGLQDGLSLNKGNSITPIQNPLKTAYKAVKVNKESEEFKKGLSNLLSYDGTSQEVKDE